MSSNRRQSLNENTKKTELTADEDSDSKVLSKAETLYVSLMCLVVSCLSSVTFEVGARSPLGHSVTKSATFNALFRHMIIKIPMGNFVSSLISTIFLALGEKYRIPYLYLPWLINTFKGMIFNEGPALVSLSHNQLPYAVIPASTFGFMTILLFVEEFCLWCDVFASFKRCWADYNNRRENHNNGHCNISTTQIVDNKSDGQCEPKIYPFDKPNIGAAIIHEPDAKVTFIQHMSDESVSFFNPRRTKSLITLNYSRFHE